VNIFPCLKPIIQLIPVKVSFEPNTAEIAAGNAGAAMESDSMFDVTVQNAGNIRSLPSIKENQQPQRILPSLVANGLSLQSIPIVC
jgi:hypothetical protein